MFLRRETILIIVLMLLPAVRSSLGQPVTVASSVLSSGNWTKIGITKTGIYRLYYSDLVAMGISEPANVSVYANNHGQLSFYNDNTSHDDLEKVAIDMHKGTDNIFGDGDFILFYAEGTHRWKYNSSTSKYEFSRHYYSDTAYYFITSKPGDALFVEESPIINSTPGYTSSAYDACFRYENEEVNLLGSGREWYQSVTSGTSNNISPEFTNLILSEKISYRIRVLARSDTQTTFSLRQGSQTVQTIHPSIINLSDQNGLYASIAAAEGSISPSSQAPSFSLLFSNDGNSSSRGWVDYVDLFARAETRYVSGQMTFSDARSIAPEMTTSFVIKSQSKQEVWDITDPQSPERIVTTFSNGEMTFKANTDNLKRYIIFSSDSYLSPVSRISVSANQDLHSAGSAEMIIISHPDFIKQAERIAALHSEYDGLTSLIVTPGQIYNEFSGGITDAVALRNYVKMVYERSKGSPDQLRFLLLLGDGSYENKTRPPLNPAYIPTWQSVNSNTGIMSFTSDDFFGLLDEGEGEATGYLDIGIGRIPVNDTASARIVTDKIGRYMKKSSFGSWRNVITLVADDEDNNIHMTDAENLSVIIEAEAPSALTDKIYLDAYRQISSISGNTYPDATIAINNRIESGTLLFNYVGHGSETGLAHEKVVRTTDINAWDNTDMMPLVITATCEFSRFDNVTINPSTGAITPNTSAGELILLNPDGGGVALMSTTRVVYSAPNYTLNSNILKCAFEKAADGSSMRLGDIIRIAKINSGSGTNKRNFSLLGDPALRLAWPQNGTVSTDSINHISVENVTDTLKALSKITVSGHIQSVDGAPDDSFNGIIEPIVYDKMRTVTTLGNDGGPTMTYAVYGNILFKGVTSVTNGRFSFSFIVPLDIDYTYGEGRITYYAWDNDIDVNGFFNGITVGGFSNEAIDDHTGPSISLFMNDTLFRNGDITDGSPILLAHLSDESGINVSGAGIGHDIVAWLDDETSESVVLNSMYKSDPTGVFSGTLSYPLNLTDDGRHTLTLRAWDNLNNFSQATLDFVVRTEGDFTLTNILCYPNPASEEVRFNISHNRPDEKIDVTLKIFNSSGELIRILKESSETGGYKIPEIIWDRNTASGYRAARGIYIWKAEATTSSGSKATAAGRVVIL